MSELKPTFTDVKQRKVVAKIVEEVGFEYLSIETINADGESTSQILELNVYDAKRLSEACEAFLKRSIARNFAQFSGHLTPHDRVELANEEVKLRLLVCYFIAHPVRWAVFYCLACRRPPGGTARHPLY